MMPTQVALEDPAPGTGDRAGTKSEKSQKEERERNQNLERVILRKERIKHKLTEKRSITEK